MANRFTEAYSSSGRSAIAANSTAVQTGDFVAFSGSFVTTAGASSVIIGVSNQTKTYTSDNQTVAQESLSYTPNNDTHVYRVAITGGTITAADVGKYFNLSDARTVDGTTESTVKSTVDTSDTGSATDPVVSRQLKMVKFISATLADFVLA